jgi:hypothetical protein
MVLQTVPKQRTKIEVQEAASLAIGVVLKSCSRIAAYWATADVRGGSLLLRAYQGFQSNECLTMGEIGLEHLNFYFGPRGPYVEGFRS